VRFADGAHEAFNAIVWATGYRDDSSWLRITGATDARGNYVHDRGVSPVPGVFYLGRHWQNTRSSALLCGVGREATALVRNVTGFVRRKAPG
jgi:putative flavoprotein involved in K+ transport